MQTHTSNTFNHSPDGTSISSAALDASLTVKVTNMLEALVTAFGGCSQIGSDDIARAIAGNIRNQGWGRYRALDVVKECAFLYGTRWDMAAVDNAAQADEILVALVSELTSQVFKPFDEVIKFADACAAYVQYMADSDQCLGHTAARVASDAADARMYLGHAKLAAVIRPKEGAAMISCLECMAAAVRWAYRRALNLTRGATPTIGLREAIDARIDACISDMHAVFSQ